MDALFAFPLGAKEQPRERQTRWIPLWTLHGTTSDTLTPRMLRGMKLPSTMQGIVDLLRSGCAFEE